MSRHEGPPLGSAAREATAPPYHGKRRKPAPLGYDRDGDINVVTYVSPEVFDDPPRCGSCGHVQADECGCSCCTWDEHQERPADV